MGAFCHSPRMVIPDQPDNDGSLEHYIASSARGWNDLTDIRQLTAYICEKGRTNVNLHLMYSVPDL